MNFIIGDYIRYVSEKNQIGKIVRLQPFDGSDGVVISMKQGPLFEKEQNIIFYSKDYNLLETFVPDTIEEVNTTSRNKQLSTEEIRIYIENLLQAQTIEKQNIIQSIKQRNQKQNAKISVEPPIIVEQKEIEPNNFSVKQNKKQKMKRKPKLDMTSIRLQAFAKYHKN